MNVALHSPCVSPKSPHSTGSDGFQVGDRVRMDFRGQMHEAMIKTIMDDSTVVVVAENLLLPIACSRGEIQRIGDV